MNTKRTAIIRLIAALVGTLTPLSLFADRIHDAAKSGDIPTIKTLLAEGVDVNTKDKDGNTPLHFAAMLGRTDVAKLLLAKGADLNARDNWGSTPLERALQADYDEMVEVVLATKTAAIQPPDQIAIAEAITADGSNVRVWGRSLLAVYGLTDQVALAEIARRATSANIRYAAAGKIADASVLSAIADAAPEDAGSKMQAIAAIRKALVRVQPSPRISLRVLVNRGHKYRSGLYHEVEVWGQEVTIKIIVEDGIILAKRSWETTFPDQFLYPSVPPKALPANINVDDLLLDLWGRKDSASWLLAHGDTLKPAANPR